MLFAAEFGNLNERSSKKGVVSGNTHSRIFLQYIVVAITPTALVKHCALTGRKKYL